LGLLLAWSAHPVLQAQTASVVSVNADNVLVINGRKVFPIGMSPCPPNYTRTPTGKDSLQELCEAGALISRISQTNNWNSALIAYQQAALDWSAQHGLYAWINLRELSQFPSTDTNTPAALANLVDTFKQHPAMGVWKNADEAWWAKISATNLQNGYEVIRQQDTNHPVQQTHAPRGTVADLQPYNAAADIIAVDIYPVTASGSASNPPITNTGISQVGDWTLVMAQVANGQKQFWTIEQIAFSGTTPPAKTLVFPTFTQSRYMAYQALINGARGLMFFGGNITATLTPEDAFLGWNWTFWRDVLKSVVQQLGDHSPLAPALVAPDSTLPITVSGATAPDLEFRVREVASYLFILASKREGTNATVTFSGVPPWATSGEVLFESPRTVTAQNGQFADSFAPLGVHVYRFSQTNVDVSILYPPQSQTNYSGSTASFSVMADGTGPLAYQWRKDGANLADGGNVTGATSSTLILTNVRQSDAASYTVVVTGFGTMTSTPPATLTMSNQFPVIVVQPQSRTNTVGTTVLFSVTAIGSPPLSYHWRRNGANLANGSNLAGVTTSALTLTNVSPADAGSYDVVVNGFGSVTSTPPAGLTVLTQPLLLYEPFNYNNIGSPVTSNTPANWAYGGSNPNDLNVAPGNLSYPGLAASVGNSVTNGGAGLGVRRLLGAELSLGAVYFSALFRINDLGYGVWNGAASQAGMLTAPANTSHPLQIMVKSNSPSGYVFGVQKAGGSAMFDTVERHTGDTVLLVGKYDFTASPNAVSLWINPASFTFGAASEPATGFIAQTTGTDGLTIDRFNMRQNTTASVPAAMQWDELRVGTSWASVTPPATSPVSPTLTAARVGSQIVLSWPTNAARFTLETNATVSGLGSWSTLDVPISTIGGESVVTDSVTAGSLFYRLRWP
jgi:hypothetical protein